MKNSKFIYAAMLAGVATSAFAADPAYVGETAARQVSGYGQLYAGGVWLDYDLEGFENSTDEFWTAGGTGQVNVPFADFWNFQGGIAIDVLDESGDTALGFGAQGHLYWRDSMSHAVGAFVELKTYDMPEDPGDTSKMWDWRVGPEAQLYLDRVTLYGQLWYGGIEAEFNGESENADAWGIRGVARYFMTDNFRLDGELAYYDVSADELSMDTFAASLQAMYRFTDSPVSIFGLYQYETSSIDDFGLDLNKNKFLVGLRLSFGSSTLFDEDRNGATMDTYQPALLVSSY